MMICAYDETYLPLAQLWRKGQMFHSGRYSSLNRDKEILPRLRGKRCISCQKLWDAQWKRLLQVVMRIHANKAIP